MLTVTRSVCCVSLFLKYNSDGVDSDQGYKENNIELHISPVCIVPMFFGYDQNIPVYLITLLNLSDTHPRCKELENNGFSV